MFRAFFIIGLIASASACNAQYFGHAVKVSGLVAYRDGYDYVGGGVSLVYAADQSDPARYEATVAGGTPVEVWIDGESGYGGGNGVVVEPFTRSWAWDLARGWDEFAAGVVLGIGFDAFCLALRLLSLPRDLARELR